MPPSIETIAVRADRALRNDRSVAPALHPSASYHSATQGEFEAHAGDLQRANFYSRYGSPNAAQTAAIVAAMEGAEAALITASGMAALATLVLAHVHSGDHVVAQNHLYGGTIKLLQSLLPGIGAGATFVDQADPQAFRDALKATTRLVILETPSNPAMRITDLQAVGAIAREHGALSVVDNTFATPFNQQPITLGIDAVIHSATKYMSGHSDMLAGAIAGRAGVVNRAWETSLVLGNQLGAFECWLLQRSLRTLPLRVERHNRTALTIARYLDGHPAVERVLYPGLPSHPQHALAARQMRGFGGVLSFELRGGKEAADSFMNRASGLFIAPSLGSADSLLVQPVIMNSRQVSAEHFDALGVRADLIRMAVGLEHEDDLIRELEQALA